MVWWWEEFPVVQGRLLYSLAAEGAILRNKSTERTTSSSPKCAARSSESKAAANCDASLGGACTCPSRPSLSPTPAKWLWKMN